MSDGSLATLQGGRYLAELYQKDSVQAAFIQKIINAVNKLGANLGANPVGNVAPPPSIDNVNVQTSGEMMQVTLNHNHPVGKAVNYFVEVDTNSNFTQPYVQHLGASRSSLPFNLPTKDSKGNNHAYYVRAYSQYPGSAPSKHTVFGGPLAPAAVTMGGGTQMDFLPSTGSGTASPTGQQGGQGFGNIQNSFKIGGPVQASVGAASAQANQSASGVIGSLSMPTNTFAISGSQPITALPNGGAILAAFINQTAGTFLAGPQLPPAGTAPITDKVATADPASSSTITLGPVTPTIASELALLVVNQHGDSISSGPGGSWVQESTTGLNSQGAIFHEVLTSVAPVNPTVTYSASNTHAGLLATFFSPNGTPTIVNTTKPNTAQSVGTNTFSLSATASAGNTLLFIAIGYGFGTGFSFTNVTDNSGDTFNLVATRQAADGTGIVACYAASNIAGGATSISYTFAGSDTSARVCVYEVTNLLPSAGQPLWRGIVNTDLDNAVFGSAGGGSNNAGAVPNPGGTTHTPPYYLGDDAAWHNIFYQDIQQAGATKTQRLNLNFLSPITVTDNSGNNSSDVNVPVFGASGGSHSTGLVPDPGSSAGTTHFLREDATWVVPSAGGGAQIKRGSYTAVSGDSGTTICFKDANNYAFVQGVNAPSTGGTTVNFASSTTSGNLVVAGCVTNTSSSPTPSGGGVAWTQVGTPQNRGDGWYLTLFFGVVTGTPSTTISFSGTVGSFSSVYALEFSGNPSSSLLDQHNQGTGSGANPTGSVTASQVSDLIIGWFNSEAAPGSFTNIANYSSQPTSGNSNTWLLYRPVGVNGTNNPGVTFAATSAYGFITASFNPQSATAPTLTLPSSPPSSTWSIYVKNDQTNLSLIINPNGLTLDGSSSNLSIPPTGGFYITTDGSNYFSVRGNITPAPSVALTAQTGSISSTALVAAPITTNLYQVSYYLNDTVAGTSGSVTLTITWNDGASQTFTSSTLNFGTLGAFVSGTLIVKATSGAINYSTTVTSPVGSPQYSVDIRVLPLG